MRLEKLKKQFPRLKENEPLKNHCTFRVGGAADLFYELLNIDELPSLIIAAQESGVTYRVIGRGSNSLFTDKGFRGLIIKNLTNKLTIGGGQLRADSGVPLALVIHKSVDNHLTGLEPLYGLPGSIGSAVWGNAGVPGTEISHFLNEVQLFNPADGVCTVKVDDLKFAYRWSSLQDSHDTILRCSLLLKNGQKNLSQETIKKIDEIRRGKQPTGYTAGSFFKNPSKEKSAGYLIEQCGLKGSSLGGAEISPKHANFFMNKGNATAGEILELARRAEEAVQKKFAISLEREVKVIGDL